VARALAASLFMAQGPSLVVTAVSATALRVEITAAMRRSFLRTGCTQSDDDAL
jgi:hypothetical protein